MYWNTIQKNCLNSDNDIKLEREEACDEDNKFPV